MPRKIINLVGARPQFIKAAPVIRELKKYFDVTTVHTGQHYDKSMSAVFFKEFNLKKPDYNLSAGSGTHAQQTAKIMVRLEKILLSELPDLLIVYGDTNSTVAGTLTAAKLHIPVAHIEAGMRSFNRDMPEEINRIMTMSVAKYLFAPTKTALANLKDLDKSYQKKYLVGDVMYDALLSMVTVAEKKSKILTELEIGPKSYYLLTLHRDSNTDSRTNLKSIVEAVSHADRTIVFPVHPRTKKMLIKFKLLNKLLENRSIKLTEPLGYLDILNLEKNSLKILTDSGGIQKEAYLLKVPCITLRDQTEWVETVKSKKNILTGADKNRIKAALKTFRPSGSWPGHFGNGNASKKIARILDKELHG